MKKDDIFDQINQLPIEDILRAVNIPITEKNGETYIEHHGNFTSKYRVWKEGNSVSGFEVSLPKGTPFYFIRDFLELSTGLHGKELHAEVFKWFRGYLNIDEKYDGNELNNQMLQKLKERSKERKKEEEIGRIERIKDIKEMERLYNHALFPIKSKAILDYFSGRNISKKTLDYEGVKIGKLKYGNNTYENRVFAPMSNSLGNFTGFKARNIYAKGDQPKTITTRSSIPGLIFKKEDVEGKDFAFLVEGEIDKYTMTEMGMLNTYGNASGASVFREEWGGLLNKHKRIYVMYDMDEGSLSGLKGIRNIILNNLSTNVKFLDFNIFYKLYHEKFKDTFNLSDENMNDMRSELTDINDIYSMFKEGYFTNPETQNIKECNHELLTMLNKSMVSMSLDEINDFIKKEAKKFHIKNLKINFDQKLKVKNELGVIKQIVKKDEEKSVNTNIKVSQTKNKGLSI